MTDRGRFLVRFGAYELDAEARELRRHGRLVRLTPQALRLLTALTTSPDAVVTRESLRRALWPDDVHVEFERGLNSAMRKLRVALQEDADHPRYVQTVPGQGYRFIAPIHRVALGAAAIGGALPGAAGTRPTEPGPLTDTASARARDWRSGWRRTLAASLLACVAGAGAILLWTWQATPRRMLIDIHANDARLHVVVSRPQAPPDAPRALPDEMTIRVVEALRVQVGRFDRSRLGVVGDRAHASHELIVTTHTDAAIARAFVRLVDRRSDEQLWGGVIDAPITQLEHELTMAAGRAVADRLLGGDADARLIAATTNDRALERYRLAKALTGERMNELSRAVEAFDDVVQRDPGFAPAWAGLARARAARAMFDGRDASELTRAREAAQRALAVDARLSDAHLALGLVRFALDGDTAGGEADLRAARALGATAGRDDLWLVWVLNVEGRNTEALALLDDAIAQEPRNASLHARRGMLLHALRRYDEELVALQRAVSLTDGSWEPSLQLGLGYSRRRQYDLALPALRRAVDLSGSSGLCLSWLGRIAADAGDMATAGQVLRQLRDEEPGRGLAPSLAASVAYHIAARQREAGSRAGL